MDKSHSLRPRRFPLETSNSNVDSPVKKTQKDYSKEYRDRVKDNPQLYKLVRAEETRRNKEYKKNRSDEAVIRDRELQKLRQQKYRQRLKDSQQEKKRVPKTRHTLDHERKQWAQEKRVQRANMSHQKRAAVNKKRREAYAAKKKTPTPPTGTPQPSENLLQLATETLDTPQTDISITPSTSTSCSGSSNNAVRTAKSRFKKNFLHNLPSNTKMRAEVISAGLEALSPKSRQCVNGKLGILSPMAKRRLHLGYQISKTVKERIVRSKMARSTREMKLRRLFAQAIVISNRAASQHFGVSRKMRRRVRESIEPGWEERRARRKDAISVETVNNVNKFFNSGTVSRDMPDARGAVVEEGEVKPRKVLESSLRTVYNEFVEQNGRVLSFSTFKKLKPKRVLPFTSHKFNECLCEYCANMDLKIQAINSQQCTRIKIQDRYEASRLTLCPKLPGSDYKKLCIDRKCNDCGARLFSNHMQSVFEGDARLCRVEWWQWSMVPNPTRPTSSKMMKVKKETTFQELVEATSDALGPFSLHLFNAKWQWQQYNVISGNVPQRTVVCCMDFAENYTVRPQDTPQGHHWTNTQCTIHPVVASYQCLSCDGGVVTDSIVFITSDQTHDYHAVQHFLAKSVELLQSENLCFDRLITFSDGAPTQYKNRINFVDCSHAMVDFGVMSERHYFGSRHGKGPCDREIGVIKKSVNRSVAARQVDMTDARSLFELCNSRLQLPREAEHSHTKRRFLWVEPADINRDRPLRTETKPLKDTRKHHCIKGIQPFVVSVRERSCFCEGCEGNTPCINADASGPWMAAELAPTRKRGQTQPSVSCSSSRPNNHVPLPAASGNSTSLSAPDNSTSLSAPDNSTPLSAPDNSTSLSAPDNSTSLSAPDNATSLSAPDNATSLSAPDNSTPLSAPDNSTSLSAPDNSTSLSAPDNSTPLSAPDNSTSLSAPENSTSLSAPDNSTSLSAPDNSTSLSAPDNSTSLSAPDNSTSLSAPDNSTSLSAPDNATPLPAPQQPPQQDRLIIKVGDFVRANILPANGAITKAKSFIGIVEAVDNDGTELRFLRKIGQHYVMSDILDTSFVFFNEILDIMPVPRIDGRGRHFF